MSKHTPGPLFVSVQNSWPFKIVTKNSDGDVVFVRDMPSNSTRHKSAQEAITGKGLDPEWEAEKHNRRALADEVLRAAAPELLQELKKRAINARQSAFDDWLSKESPSGDVEQVHRQWEASSAHANFVDEWGSALDAIAKATGEQA